MNDRAALLAPERADFLRTVVDASMTAIVVVDAQGRIIELNRRTEELFGRDRGALLGGTLDRLIPTRFQGSHGDQVRRFFDEPSARPMGMGRELFGQRADGTEFPVEIGLSPVEANGQQYTLASIIDITQRRRAEDEQARLAAIVESSRDAILSKAPDGTVTSWNRAAELLFGYSAEEMIGQNINHILPADHIDEEAELLRRVGGGERVDFFETQRLRRDGSRFDVAVTLSPLYNRGRIVGTSSIIRDITQAKQRDAELRRSNAELEQFAYVASHDLQEPLRMVANYVELLAERYRGALDERAQKYIHFASDGAHRMQQLVSDLLAYSRVGSQGKPLVRVDTSKVVDRVVNSLARQIRDNDARVECGPLPSVMGDEGQLAQLFQNLVVNAIKFRSAAPPVVRIDAARHGAMWRFSVVDNGIGMEMRFADRIFQMFQRLNSRDQYQGSGIGLAIAKRIVERHGGMIWAESEPEVGSTFHFTLRHSLEGSAE